MTGLRLVALQEEGWDKGFLQQCGGAIYTVFLYDPEKVTYCCEYTPSYALYYIESFPLLEGASDELLDRIQEAQTERIDYYHCNSIDRIPYPSEYHRWLSFFKDEEESYESFIEAALDHARSNGGLYAGEREIYGSESVG